jgi:hypothetical protein
MIMRKRWDNIEILQAIDQLQERYGGGPVTAMNGMYLMNEINGSQVTEPSCGEALSRNSILRATWDCSPSRSRPTRGPISRRPTRRGGTGLGGRTLDHVSVVW